MIPRPLSCPLLTFLVSLSRPKTVTQWLVTQKKTVELEGQLSEKKDKLEQVQEKNVEYLEHVSQLFQDKVNNQHLCEQLQIQNASLKQQLKEL